MKEIKSRIKVLTSVMLIAVLTLLTVSTANIAQAASKPSIDSKYTIGTGSIWGYDTYYLKGGNF